MFDELYGLIVVVSLFVYGCVCVCVCARVWKGAEGCAQDDANKLFGWLGGWF